jgi:hypothetical protein
MSIKGGRYVMVMAFVSSNPVGRNKAKKNLCLFQVTSDFKNRVGR